MSSKIILTLVTDSKDIIFLPSLLYTKVYKE